MFMCMFSVKGSFTVIDAWTFYNYLFVKYIFSDFSRKVAFPLDVYIYSIVIVEIEVPITWFCNTLNVNIFTRPCEYETYYLKTWCSEVLLIQKIPQVFFISLKHTGINGLVQKHKRNLALYMGSCSTMWFSAMSIEARSLYGFLDRNDFTAERNRFLSDYRTHITSILVTH